MSALLKKFHGDIDDSTATNLLELCDKAAAVVGNLSGEHEGQSAVNASPMLYPSN